MTAPDPRDWPGYDRGPYGAVLAKIHVDDLEDWAWILAHVEDWLAHAGDATIEDHAVFAGPCRPCLDDVIYMLGHMASYMTTLAEGAPK